MAQFKDNTFPLARLAKESGFFDSGSSFLLDSPTGSGKTRLVAELARRETAQGHSCVIAVPLRALADELYERLRNTPDFPRNRVTLCTGARRMGRPWRFGALTIATYEAFFLQTTLQRLEYLSSLAFAAIDEIHLLESDRGALLEETILRLRRANPFCRIIALSGTLDPADPMGQWLDAACLRVRQRPVPLELKTVFAPASRRFDAVCQYLTKDTRPALIFVHSRRRAAQWAQRLCERGIPAAVHHAGLSAAAQARVVQRLQNREIQAVVATPTLEMGVNLPVERVFCPDLVFPDATGWRRIPARALHQRLGRAGRPKPTVPAGENAPPAEGIVFAPPGSPDPLRESFGPVRSRLCEHLDSFILHEIAHGFCRNLLQIRRAFALSLAYAQRQPADWDSALKRLAHLGLIQTAAESAGDFRADASLLALTALGKAAARQFGQLAAFAGAMNLFSRPCTWVDCLWIAFACQDAQTYLEIPQLLELMHEITPLPSHLARDPGPFPHILGISRRQAVCALAATAAFLAWARTPPARREDHVYWNASWETQKLRNWRAWRCVDSWLRAAASLPDGILHPETEAALRTVREMLSKPRRAAATPTSCATETDNAPTAATFPPLPFPLPPEWEPRVERALQCTVTPAGDENFFVVHKGRPWHATAHTCACPDFSPDRPCKHVLAVRLQLKRHAYIAFDIWTWWLDDSTKP